MEDPVRQVPGYLPRSRRQAAGETHFDRLIDARNFKAEVRMKKQRGEYVDPRDAKTPFEVWAA